MTTETKENAMICTGAVPPHLILGIELYQLYMQGMMNYWQLYSSMAGINQWAKLVQDSSKNS